MVKTIKRIALFLLITTSWVIPVTAVCFAITQGWFIKAMFDVLCAIVIGSFAFIAIFIFFTTWLYVEDKIR